MEKLKVYTPLKEDLEMIKYLREIGGFLEINENGEFCFGYDSYQSRIFKYTPVENNFFFYFLGVEYKFKCEMLLIEDLEMDVEFVGTWE